MEYTFKISDEKKLSILKKTKLGIVFTTLKDIISGLSKGDYRVTIDKIRPTRSIQQNKYYWACLGLICVEVGYISEEMEGWEKSDIVEAMHEIFKDRFLGGKTFMSTKDKRKKIKKKGSTKVLDSGEFTIYLNKIRSLHPYLPDPEDKNLLTFIDTYYFKK